MKRTLDLDACCRLSTADRRLLLALLLFLPFLQGCSLLFVAGGSTHYSQTEGEKVPEAVSLSKSIGAPVVLTHKVKAGDTQIFLAEKYYGRASAVGKIAAANGLAPKAKLKVGSVLKIPAPLYFPGPDEMVHKPTPTPVKAEKPSASPTRTFTPIPTPKTITQVARPKVNKAFAPGEVLKFELRALGVLGGYASLSVEDYVKVEGRPCTPLVVRANTVFPFTAIYPVKDVQTSYFDAVDFITWKFENVVNEGNYHARNKEVFDQVRHKVVRKHNDEDEIEGAVAPFTQDIISCFYYFRLLPMEVGKTYMIPTASGGKNYQLIVNVEGKEKITVPAGTFDCFKVKPLIRHGTVFRNEEDIDIWMSADERHIPVKIKSGIVIGSIDVDLLEAKLPKIK